MSRARTLAGAIGSDGALNVADVAGLAAVASSGSASDLSTGTLPIARIADSAVTAAKLHTTAVTDKLGYTPVNKAGDTMTGGLVMGGNSRVVGSSAAFALRKSSAFMGQLYLDFQDSTGTEIGYLGYGSAGNDKLTLANTLSDVQLLAGSALGVVINTTGRVTKPNNPAFFAYGLPGSANNHANSLPTGGLTFGTTVLNQGNRWDGKTFTADVAGVYFMHFSQMYHHEAGDITFQIHKSGGAVAYNNPYSKDLGGDVVQWAQNEVTWIGSMGIGDTITFHWSSNNDSSTFLYGGGLYTRVMGYLIG